MHKYLSVMTDKMHPGLKDLRQRIKEVMIPLLVEVFETKLAAQGSSAPTSRLHPPSLKSRDQIYKELETIHADIKLLLVWGQSCERQIAKALDELNEKPKPTFRYTLSSSKEANPDVSKSFSETIASKKTPIPAPTLLISLKLAFKKLAFWSKNGQ